MPCSEEEALVRLFHNASSSFLLLFLLFYYSTLVLGKFFYFLGSNSIFSRNQTGYDYNLFSEDEDEEEEEEAQEEEEEEEEEERCYHFETDIIHSSEVVFLSANKRPQRNQTLSGEFINPSGSPDEDCSTETLYADGSGRGKESEHKGGDVFEEKPLPKDTDSICKSAPNQHGTTLPITIEPDKNGSGDKDRDKDCHEDCRNGGNEVKKAEINFSTDEKFITYAPPKWETKKLLSEEKEDEIFGDSFNAGSTSKSSSDWRSSINYRDSETEDQFSSSSRRSCPKWESYTVFQKYDEEMMFLDRISAQKLQETESLRSIQVCPRSISERIVHKFATINKKPSDIRQNPYRELEAAYVAQICITWEALNWNYKNFQQKRASRRDNDPGCPAAVAQEFQQFQVLLLRYIENEPYEQGRRPEIYARMRLLAPKLLLVPEYRDSGDDQKEDGYGSRISSAEFLIIMEDGIRTFMNFLQADKEKPCQIISAFFRRSRRCSVDPTLLRLMKKVNRKKKMKLKDLRRARKCLRKRKLKVNDEMEILMGLIDLKVVSRVMRMAYISEQQMQWCEEKMSKVKILEGKLQRDSLPLFFPAH